MSVRYYLYISDAKVDMLLTQIDSGFDRKRSVEWSIGAKMFGAKRTVEAAPSSRITRLERVVRHLDDFADVGSVDQPGQFFRGVLPVQWGNVPAEGGATLVFFGGRTEHTIVGLGGSSTHIVGATAATPAGSTSPAEQGLTLAASVLPMLLSGLADDNQASDTRSAPAEGTEAALATVHQACARLRGPIQNVEFLAKRLLWGPSPYPELGDGRSVLLGSPLYVALVD